MAKRLMTYRLDGDVADAVAARARELGESVTDMLTRACLAYIHGGVGSVVYTPPEREIPARRPVRHEAPPRPELEPERAPCRHPAELVFDGVCECGAEFFA